MAAQVAAARGRVQIPNENETWQTPEKYQLRHSLGIGSYGEVCEALDTERQRVVAIKRIRNVFNDLVDCKRILREIAILNRLNHEHVVRVLDICVPPDLMEFNELYFVLEVADSDLKKLFKSEVFLSELHIKTILYNLLIGLKYINSAGIYHRDIKPGNCLVNINCLVKICDFGLARTVDYPQSDDHKLPTSPHENDIPVGVPHTQRLRQQLTGHVVTRWYRAPELILLQENYTEAIDVWSVGCIFAELLGMMQANVSDYRARGPIFPGSSCFPLSPDQRSQGEHRHPKRNRDQLTMIFSVLGTPSEEDVEAIEKDDAKRYIKLFPEKPPAELKAHFPAASEEAVDLLKKMLVFNPKRRISVPDALSHELFGDIRAPESEKSADFRVRLPFDDWGSLQEKQLRYAFISEIQRYHKDVRMPKELEGFAPQKAAPRAAAPPAVTATSQ